MARAQTKNGVGLAHRISQRHLGLCHMVCGFLVVVHSDMLGSVLMLAG